MQVGHAYHTGFTVSDIERSIVFYRDVLGLKLVKRQDIITETMPTWDRTLSVYQERSSEIVHRYGRRIVERTRAQLHRIPAILAHHGSFPVLSLLK